MKNKKIAKIKTWVGVSLMNYTYSLVQLSEKNLMGKVLCGCHRTFLNILNVSFYPVESAISYKAKYSVCDIIPIKTNRKGYVCDAVFEVEKTLPSLEERKLPNLNLYHYHDVMIQGDSDMVVDKHHNCVINDYCYNLDTHVKFVDGLLYQLKSNLCILRSNLKCSSRELFSGIMICGKFSRNFYHEILENLIKLVVLDDVKLPKDVPLIVDASVKKIPAFGFIMSKLTRNHHREVIYIQPDELCIVKDLYAISFINSITPHLTNRVAAKGDIIFDVEILKRFRDNILPWKSNKEFPKRIFLTRKNSNHRNFNEAEIFKLLEPFGVVMLAPEEYSFPEQVSLFNQAELIIGGTGASFTNLIFIHAGCKVLCIRPNVDGNPTAFTVMASMNHGYFLHYRSDEKRTNDNIHSDYYVDPKRFIEQLTNFMNYEG